MMRAAGLGLLALVAACDRTIVQSSPEDRTAVAETGPTAADPTCDQIVEALTGYAVEPAWTVVTRSTLLSSDAELWSEYHDAALCPGVAEGDLDGDGSSEFAITEIRRSEGGLRQRLRIYRPSKGTTEEVWSANDVPFAYVVYSTTDRQARDFYTGQVTAIQHGSFVLERMEASAEVYFDIDGQLHHVLVSD